MADWLLTWKKSILVVAAALLLVVAALGLAFVSIDHRDVSTSWELRGISGDGRTVTIGYLRSSCDSLRRIEKKETTAAVTLKVVLRTPTNVGCEDGIAETREVELARPLGSRDLLGKWATNWDLRDVSDDGRTLTIGYRESRCESRRILEKSETTEETKITLTVVLRQRIDGGCDEGLPGTIELELVRPLGSRALVNGETGFEHTLSPLY